MYAAFADRRGYPIKSLSRTLSIICINTNAKLTCVAVNISDVEDDARNSHLLFTIHVYQYRVERTNEEKCGSMYSFHILITVHFVFMCNLADCNIK